MKDVEIADRQRRRRQGGSERSILNGSANARRVRRRPALVAWTLVAAALVSLLLTTWSYFRAADQLAGHRAEEKYQQFIQRRNEALVYGLLAPDEGALFLGADAVANRKTAESAAREALTLAGVDVESETASIDLSLPAPREAEMAADCYALLLVLASIRAQQPLPADGGKERYQQALRFPGRPDCGRLLWRVFLQGRSGFQGHPGSIRQWGFPACEGGPRLRSRSQHVSRFERLTKRSPDDRRAGVGHQPERCWPSKVSFGGCLYQSRAPCSRGVRSAAGDPIARRTTRSRDAAAVEPSRRRAHTGPVGDPR